MAERRRVTVTVQDRQPRVPGSSFWKFVKTDGLKSDPMAGLLSWRSETCQSVTPGSSIWKRFVSYLTPLDCPIDTVSIFAEATWRTRAGRGWPHPCFAVLLEFHLTEKHCPHTAPLRRSQTQSTLRLFLCEDNIQNATGRFKTRLFFVCLFSLWNDYFMLQVFTRIMSE